MCRQLAEAYKRPAVRWLGTQPTPDYPAAVAFLERYAAEVGLPFEAIEISSGRTIVLMTWLGSEPGLPSLVLNSHTDVVPVFPGSCDPDVCMFCKGSCLLHAHAHAACDDIGECWFGVGSGTGIVVQDLCWRRRWAFPNHRTTTCDDPTECGDLDVNDSGRHVDGGPVGWRGEGW